MKTPLPLAALLLVAAPAWAQEAVVSPEGAEAQSVRFACADGRIVDVAFPDAATAALSIDDGPILGLALVPPAATEEEAAAAAEAVADPATAEDAESAAAAEATVEATAAAEGSPATAIYVGPGVQWTAQGQAAGTLAVLAPGEAVASDPGVACVPAEG